MKVCGRCDQPIKTGDEVREFPIEAGSAAGMTVYWHKKCPANPRR